MVYVVDIQVVPPMPMESGREGPKQVPITNGKYLCCNGAVIHTNILILLAPWFKHPKMTVPCSGYTYLDGIMAIGFKKWKNFI